MAFDINAFLKENKAGVAEEEPQLITSEVEPAKQTAFDINAFLQENAVSPTSTRAVKEIERREGGGIVGGAADIGIQFMKGLGTGTRMISDVFGANNPVSKSIAGYEDYFDSLLSAESKQDSQEISRILKEAEDKGILPQIMAGLEAFTVAPAEMTATTMGIMLPNLAGGVYAKAAQLGKAGVIGLQMGIGAAQGAGSIKGQIYTAVQEELRQQGLPEDKIDDIATEAQAYNGKNLDQILIGAGLGAAASSTGAEKIMTRLITGAGKEASEDIIKAVIKGGFSEAPIEALQGGQEKIAENVALQRIGVDVPTMQGVIPAATMEATAGLLIGGGFGGVEALTSPEQKEEKKIDKQSNQVANELLAENTPATQSVVKELARRENAVANLQEAYDALEPTSQEAQKLKLELSEAQRNLSAFKEVANKAGLSETITEAEKQQIELANLITKPAPKPLPTDALPTETPGAEYGREAELFDVFGGVRRRPVDVTEPTIGEIPQTSPMIGEQPAEPIISEKLETSDIVGAEPATIVEQEQVAPVESAIDVARKTNFAAAATREEAGDIGRNLASQDPSLPPLPPQQFEVLESISNFQNRKGYNPDALTGDLLNEARNSGFITGKQIGKIKLTEAGRNQLREWSDQARERSLAESALSDEISDIAVSQWDAANDPSSAAAMAARTAPAITPAPVAETPAVTEAPVAEPAGISVGNRIKLGKSPQTYIVEEVVPQSEVEKANNEQYYSVKNERTGEVQVVEKADMKQVGGKRARKLFPDQIVLMNEMVSEPSLEETQPKPAIEPKESVTPIPEANRYTFEEAVKAVDAHFGKQGIPEGVVIVNNTTEPDLEMKAGYFVNRGQIVINLAYIAKGENLGDIIDHELGHYIFGDPKFQADFKEFWDMMTPEEKVKADQIINQFYNKETGAVQMEEKQIRAFMQLIQDSKAMPKWKQIIDKIKRWINEKLGTNLQVNDRGALAVLAAAHKRFKSGEQIVREIDSGVLKSLGGEPTRERQQIMGEKIGPLKKTPEGIIAETQAKLRERFDPTKVTEQNTTEAFRALGRLTGKDGTAFAQELNDIGRMVDESGAAAEVSMGAALFVNDLFEYAVRLAAQGQKMMLGIMMTNINRLPTGTEGRTGAGQALRAAREMKNTFLTMARAEQDAFINYTAEFIYGSNPTKDQIQSIKIGYDAVEKVQEPTAEEVEEEIAAVGKKTGTDLVGRINDEFTKATEKGQAKRKTEIEELDSEYKKIQEQADKEIEKLAKIQSDTPSFDPTAARQTANDVRAIVANDLKQRPDMGRKAPWKSLLVAKLQEAGVELAAAETLADIVWRQHEINSLSRELSSINKAIEKGPISEIVKAIKDTPLEDQQNPNWRYEVMRDYLRRAGLNVAQAERIAKLMDISLQKRFTMAQEQAFTDAISKTAPWKAGDTRSRRAFQKVLQALRAGALDPARNVLSDMAALNGWTGFSPDQYKTLLKNDAILADPKSGELKKAEAYKAIQDVISKAKLPIRARDVIGQYYDAQALSGIPTLTVNAFSPIAFALRNTLVEIGSGTLKGNPKAVTNAATALVDSIKSWANTVAFSFKNNVTVYSNVDYIVNDDNLLRLYRRGVDQFNNGKTSRNKADGVKNMMVGMMDYVRRMLNALDYGAIASLQNQNISKYSMAVMKRQAMSTKEGNEMFAVMMKAKNDFYLDQIAIGTDKNKASILADEFYISSWSEALTKAGVEKSDIKQAMDAAINDALSSVGRNRQSIDALKGEATKLKDAGVSSMPALWLLESMANAANQSDNQILKLFSRVIYGFAIVPARVIRETAWFSPYGFVRFGYDAIAKKMGKTSPYAQSLGTDVQYSQRLNEAIAGTVALTALFALRAGSTDEPEDDDFKIVFTGNGPQRKDDPQFYDSWYKAGNKPNTMSVSFGKGKFDLNMMRGFEAFTWPAMMLGALDDLEIRKKQKQQTKTPTGIEDASIVAGFVFDAALRRGPYAFTTKSLFGTYGDIGVEGVAKGLTFPAKTLIPVLGTSLASNISNFINDPIDRRTLDGAVWSNIPFIGPAVAPKSLNAFGEPALSTDLASKMFKLGVPIVYDIPTDRESIKLHELVLKQGGGPSIPTRNQLAQRLDRQPTNKEYEMFVQEYGTVLTNSMKKNYDKLFNAKPEFYSKAVERIGNRARDIAENKVRVAAKKP